MIFNKSNTDNDKKNIFTRTNENGELTESSARRYFSVIGFAALAVFLIRDLLVLAGSYLFGYFAPELLTNPYAAFAVSLGSLYLVAMPVGALILKALPTATPLKTNISAKHWIGNLCVAFAFLTVGNYVSQISMAFYSAFRGVSVSNPLSEMLTDTPILLQLVSVAILAPIAEELFFRKLLCNKLLPLGEKYAVFVSASIFALAHGNFFQLFYAFLTGCFFAYIYVNTGKIKHTVIYHMIINTLGSVVVGIIFSLIDFEAMAAEDFQITVEWLAQNILPLGLILLYDLLFYGAAITGMILLYLNRRNIRLSDGLLMPPKKARVSCVLMNFGIASAILYFALSLVYSLML